MHMMCLGCVATTSDFFALALKKNLGGRSHLSQRCIQSFLIFILMRFLGTISKRDALRSQGVELIPEGGSLIHSFHVVITDTLA